MVGEQSVQMVDVFAGGGDITLPVDAGDGTEITVRNRGSEGVVVHGVGVMSGAMVLFTRRVEKLPSGGHKSWWEVTRG